MRYSYLSHLICPVCQERFNANIIQSFCHSCNSPLFARYDLAALRIHLDRDEVARRGRGMNRWHELLPVLSPWNVVSLGEGDTPLLPLPNLGTDLGLPRLYIKDESFNPTGSFKARGMAAAVSKAKELGVERLVVPTAGNAGGALAAYAARAGLLAAVYMPDDTPAANIKECRITNAETHLVKGLISDAAVLARARAEKDGFFDVSTFKEPYRLEGKKVMGYEIAEAFSWSLPDVILYPTGGGTGLVGIWKAFEELTALGWLENSRRPRMIAVQAAGCAPVVQAFETQATACTFWENAHTAASGLRVPRPFADREILRILRESGGLALAVEEDEIRGAQEQLAAREGIFAAPEGAAVFAGLLRLHRRGQVQPHERILLLNTASGMKYLEQVGT